MAGTTRQDRHGSVGHRHRSCHPEAGFIKFLMDRGGGVVCPSFRTHEPFRRRPLAFEGPFDVAQGDSDPSPPRSVRPACSPRTLASVGPSGPHTGVRALQPTAQSEGYPAGASRGRPDRAGQDSTLRSRQIGTKIIQICAARLEGSCASIHEYIITSIS